MAGYADKQPGTFETGPQTVGFRTGSTEYPTQVLIDWDGGPVAVAVSSYIEPDGLGVLISLDDARRMRHALDRILRLADDPTDRAHPTVGTTF